MMEERRGQESFIALYQPVAGELNVSYSPTSETVILENPPRFTWMPAKLEDDTYVLELSTTEGFEQENTWSYQPIVLNFFTPDHVLESGHYYWRYALLDQKGEQRISAWSTTRSFTLQAELPETPLPSRAERYEGSSAAHPRLWLSKELIQPFRDNVQQDSQYCGWQSFYDHAVLPWIEGELMKEPEPYPNHERVATLWRKMYLDCQEVLYAIRHLSVAGVILEDSSLLERAKEWLLHAASWNPEGTTSRDYNDEAAFRIAGALAWGYDWLFDILSDTERELVKEVLFVRTEQVAFHVMERSKIHHVPYDSHAVRSLSSVLVPCCIALFDEKPKAREWLDYTLEYYNALYTPWGGADGGWAEGPHYWMTGMAYVIEGMNLIKNFNGLDLYQRPFFQKTGDFPLYVYSPDTARASFGDIANLGEKPGLKVGFNIRQYAGVTGNGYYQWFYERTKEWDTDTKDAFYNKGWWDFYFDDMLYQHDYPTVEAKEPADIEPVKWFKDVGWVAMHHNMHKPEEHIMFLTKSSPYGSISHSHGDQNAFVLHAFGDPLAIHSGYYIAFNSTMHMQWRRQTISKNALLIDGKGQFAEKDKFLGKEAKGFIETVESHSNYHMVRGDATAAYQYHVPKLQRYVRETYFVNQSYFVMVDYVDLEEEASVDWLLHSLSEMKLHHQAFMVEGQKGALEGRFVYCSSGELTLSQQNDFEEVDPAELVGLPDQWHLRAKSKQAKRHRIVTLLTPMKLKSPKYISYVMDDQDHGIQFYFTEDGQTFRLEVAKAYSL